MADRSFNDTPMTRGRSGAPLGRPDPIFSSSPTVLTSSRRGDAAARRRADRRDGRIEHARDDRPVSRSNQSLPMIPLTDGVAPVSIVEWPMAVTVG
jgi:hypothetical protein